MSIRSHRVGWDACLPGLDACAILASLAAARILTGGSIEDATLLLAMLAAVIFLVIGQFSGLHRHPKPATADQEVALVATTWMLTVLALALLTLPGRGASIDALRGLFTWLIIAPATIGICRMCTRIIHQGCIRQGVGVRRVAIAGFNDLGHKVAAQLENNESLGWQLLGHFDDGEEACDAVPWSGSAYQLTGDLNHMIKLAHSGEIDTILVALPMRAEQRMRTVLRELSDSTVSLYIVPDIFAFELLHARWINVGHLPAVSVFENPLDGVDAAVKRLTDLSIATLALLAAVIPMALIAIAVKATSPGPVFFRQRRYGLDGREIRVWKFRSMRTCEDGATVVQVTRGDRRVTPLGAFLRRTSLDELPQLFNVLGGSMSLVGPRPHATAHNEAYRRQILGYMLRHKVKPGITGLAQVSGCRGETDTLDKMQRRVELDHQYIRSWSLWLDLKILYRTLGVVCRKGGAY